MRCRRLQALLVTNPENRYYLSGFTALDPSLSESAGALLIPGSGAPYLLTDFRYQLQAEAEAKGFEVVLYPRGLVSLLQKLVGRLGLKRVAFEGDGVTHVTAERIIESLKGPGVEVRPVTGLVEGLRVCKGSEELVKIRRAVRMNEEVFQEVYAQLKPGISEKEVAWTIEAGMRVRGAEGPSFATIVASGPNSALPHALPTDHRLRAGEPVVIDMGVRLDGYCSDMTRTVVLGRPDRRTVELFRLVRRAQLAGINAIRPGVTARSVDRAARSVIGKAGHGRRFGHGLGHGVGLAVHESPGLNRWSRKKLKPGMVVTVEPGIYLPGWGGIRLENMVVVSETGCEVLNRDTTYLDI
ncbi:MAG: Xaa-Pro peptidase family protein [Desulfobacterales bacterium]|nr:Xaa-Pro peptidase family protein [Desulfobacterales bacterium]